MWFNFAHLFSVSLLPLSTAWMAVSRLSPQPVAFYAAVFFFVLLIWELIGPRADVVSKVRRNMRYRSIATLCLFGIASLVALKYPFLGLEICCCCLVGYLRPDGPGANRVQAHYVLTVRRLGSTLSAWTCASKRADIDVARPERVLGSRRAA
jgi:hypothetical protein